MPGWQTTVSITPPSGLGNCFERPHGPVDDREVDIDVSLDALRGDHLTFLAHALIVPSASPEDRARHDAEVEQIAMDLAWAYEEAAGAVVKDVHTPELARAAGLTDNPGFDLLSIRPAGERRAIEVKGRAGTGDVEVSSNEWARAAKRHGPADSLLKRLRTFARTRSRCNGQMLVER